MTYGITIGYDFKKKLKNSIGGALKYEHIPRQTVYSRRAKREYFIRVIEELSKCYQTISLCGN